MIVNRIMIKNVRKVRNNPPRTYREALARELWAIRSIMIKQGYYTSEKKRQQQEAIKQHMAKFPDLYKKLTPRQELALDLIESTRIVRRQGLYNSEYRRQLLEAVQEQIKKDPIYKKE